jgi:16S rRNA processing protein RimM
VVIEACFKIGFVQKTHGLKGEVTIALDNNAPEDISVLRTFFIEDNNRLVPYFVSAISLKGNKAFVKLDDVDSIDDAARLVSKSIYLEKSTRPRQARGEFYDDEVLAFSVIDSKLGALGKVKDVERASSNRLLVVDYLEKEILIPVNGPFITSINRSKRTVSVTLPEGFLDI